MVTDDPREKSRDTSGTQQLRSIDGMDPEERLARLGRDLDAYRARVASEAPAPAGAGHPSIHPELRDLSAPARLGVLGAILASRDRHPDIMGIVVLPLGFAFLVGVIFGPALMAMLTLVAAGATLVALIAAGQAEKGAPGASAEDRDDVEVPEPTA